MDRRRKRGREREMALANLTSKCFFEGRRKFAEFGDIGAPAMSLE